MNFSLNYFWAVAILSITMPALTGAQGLNDTGITVCTNDTAVSIGVESDAGTHPRQDCRYGRDPAMSNGVINKVGGGRAGFDFTKIANDGSVLDATTLLGTGPKEWACTRDNVSHLIWEIKTTSGLRSAAHTYSWYKSDTATNGGFVGTPSGGVCAISGRCDTEKFVNDTNASNLCGASNWRMPTQQELNSIIDYGVNNITVNIEYFPNNWGTSSYIWTASAYAVSLYDAWGVAASYGGFGTAAKSQSHYVRLVRDIQ